MHDMVHTCKPGLAFLYTYPCRVFFNPTFRIPRFLSVHSYPRFKFGVIYKLLGPGHDT